MHIKHPLRTRICSNKCHLNLYKKSVMRQMRDFFFVAVVWKQNPCHDYWLFCVPFKMFVNYLLPQLFCDGKKFYSLLHLFFEWKIFISCEFCQNKFLNLSRVSKDSTKVENSVKMLKKGLMPSKRQRRAKKSR